MNIDLTEDEVLELQRVLRKEYKSLNDTFLESCSFIGVKVTNKKDIKESKNKLEQMKRVKNSQNIIRNILFKISK